MYIYSLIAYIQTLSKQHISSTSHPEESVSWCKMCCWGPRGAPSIWIGKKRKKFTPAEEDKSSTVALELVNSNDSQVEELNEI